MTVPEGSPFEVSVQAEGTDPIVYRWQHNGQPLADSGGPRLHVAEARLEDKGAYTCEASNAQGAVLSKPARVDVVEDPGNMPFLLEHPRYPTGIISSRKVETGTIEE